MIKVNGCDRSMEGSAVDILGDVTMILQDLITNIVEEDNTVNPTQIIEEMTKAIILNLIFPINEPSAELLEHMETEFQDVLAAAISISNNIQERFKTDEV